ncbi:MAG: hypothetical protein AB8C84_03390 [Oligoflexales bacterium]
MNIDFSLWFSSWRSDKKILFWVFCLPCLFIFGLHSIQQWSIQFLQLSDIGEARGSSWGWSSLFRLGALFHVFLGLVLLQRYQEESEIGFYGMMKGQGVSRRKLLSFKVLWAVFFTIYSLIIMLGSGFFLGFPFVDLQYEWVIHMVHGFLWITFASFLASLSYKRTVLFYILWPWMIEAFVFMMISMMIGFDISNYRFFAIVSDFGVMRSEFLNTETYLWAGFYTSLMWSFICFVLFKKDL